MMTFSKEIFIVAINYGRWQIGKNLQCWKNYALFFLLQVSLIFFNTIQTVESAKLPEKYEDGDSTVCLVLKKKKN